MRVMRRNSGKIIRMVLFPKVKPQETETEEKKEETDGLKDVSETGHKKLLESYQAGGNLTSS